MKEEMNTEKYNDKEWEEIASALSGEKGDNPELIAGFLAEDTYRTAELWDKLKEKDDNTPVDVDNAWGRLSARIRESGTMGKPARRAILPLTGMLRIAAAVLLFLSLGIATVYVVNRNRVIIASTGDTQKNTEVNLPDGSKVILNRNTELSYRSAFGKSHRKVTLSGEAFFDITPDTENPFTVDAGKASIEVVGTSFNIMTSNPDSAVEVYVETGKVMLTDYNGVRSMTLDPGEIGIMNNEVSAKSVNENPNYMSWKTGVLVYNGQTLNVVFSDLKRVYNMDIIADDPEIEKLPWVSPPIDNQSQETIILLICRSFTLSYSKDGNVYHLSRK